MNAKIPIADKRFAETTRTTQQTLSYLSTLVFFNLLKKKKFDTKQNNKYVSVLVKHLTHVNALQYTNIVSPLSLYARHVCKMY